jgi:hypothetical protein
MPGVLIEVGKAGVADDACAMPGNSQLSSHGAITIDVTENKPLKQENVGHNGAM